MDRNPVDANPVMSARLPRELAFRLAAVARERGMRPSDLIREAIEAYLSGAPRLCDVVVVHAGHRVRVLRDEPGYATENPVVTDHDLVFPPTNVALGG